jgi:hypothetical protein
MIPTAIGWFLTGYALTRRSRPAPVGPEDPDEQATPTAAIVVILPPPSPDAVRQPRRAA